MPERPVSILILCWNHWELSQRCIESVLANTDLSQAEVVVVDNGSEDETPARLREIAGIRVVTNERNLGFVGGNNAGLAAIAQDRDVVLLNNDLEILQSNWLEELQRTAQSEPDIGIVGCRLRMPDGRLLHSGTYILPETCWGQQIGATEKDLNQYANDREVQGIVFACAYIRREVLDAIGGLSEAYESYFEDTDYCLSARRAGFRTYCCGSVTLLHHEHGSTDDDPGRFQKLFGKSRKTFQRRWQKALEGAYEGSLHWQSIMNFPTGYAMSLRAFLTALERARVRCSYSYVYGAGSPFPVEEAENSGDYLLNVVAGRDPGRKPPISVVYGQGDVLSRNQGQYRIGFTMLEVDGFPKEWVRQANLMDEIWTPSTFNREGLLRSGVTRPIRLMPLGVSTEYFNPEIKSFGQEHRDFLFLSNFEWGERKAPELLLSAFNDTFKASEPVALICKVNNSDPSVDIEKEVRNLRLKADGGRITFIHNRELPYYQLGSLYRSVDCYVSAGRGEGWDMPLMEAMACGRATIATDWGAHTDFSKDDISFPLKVRGTIPAIAKCPYYEGYSWADPDGEHLRELLRFVYENQNEARARGRNAAVAMRENFSWEKAAQGIRARLTEIGGS